MAIISTPQRIELYHNGEQLWFDVWRFDTSQELQTALTKSEVRDFDAKTFAYTQIFQEGPECGRIYLLDKSVGAMAREAAKMALGIAQRQTGNILNDFLTQANYVIMVGYITAAIYSKNKYF